MSLESTWSNLDMAQKVLTLIPKNSSVNLGIGLPTLVADIISPDMNLMIHSENGVLGVDGRPSQKTLSPTLINAGKETIAIKKGASFFDSALSFGMIRGGHIDFCVLGGMQVDLDGSLANWMIPGKKITGMGGAMDLVGGAKNVIVMMSHFSKTGESKIVKKCTLPLTGFNVVNTVVTELGIFSYDRRQNREQNKSQKKYRIIELAPNVHKDDLKNPELYI